MKVLSLLALFGVASTLKLTQHSAPHTFSLVKTKTHNKKAAHQLLKMKNLVKEPECPDLSPEEEEEIADAIHGMPDDLEITGQDYLDYMEENGIELSEEEMADAEEVFHMVDTDGNGAHSKDELLAAMEAYEAHCK